MVLRRPLPQLLRPVHLGGIREVRQPATFQDPSWGEELDLPPEVAAHRGDDHLQFDEEMAPEDTEPNAGDPEHWELTLPRTLHRFLSSAA